MNVLNKTHVDQLEDNDDNNVEEEADHDNDLNTLDNFFDKLYDCKITNDLNYNNGFKAFTQTHIATLEHFRKCRCVFVS